MKNDNFYEQVYAVTRHIPKGRVTSYGAIASSLGEKGASRAVGHAMKASNDATPVVPVHRVVNSNGLLPAKLQFVRHHKELLKSEGVEIKDNKIVDFKKIFWDPAVELH